MNGPSFFLERQNTARKTCTEDTEGRERSVALDFSLDKKMNKSAIGLNNNVRMKSEANQYSSTSLNEFEGEEESHLQENML